jgi:hypothetical protein
VALTLVVNQTYEREREGTGKERKGEIERAEKERGVRVFFLLFFHGFSLLPRYLETRKIQK